MESILAMGGQRVLRPDEFDERRNALVGMLDVARGRLAQAEADVVEARSTVHRIEGGIIEQDRWIELMRAQPPAPAKEGP